MLCVDRGAGFHSSSMVSPFVRRDAIRMMGALLVAPLERMVDLEAAAPLVVVVVAGVRRCTRLRRDTVLILTEDADRMLPDCAVFGDAAVEKLLGKALASPPCVCGCCAGGRADLWLIRMGGASWTTGATSADRNV